MSVLPKSLRRVLAAQKPQQPAEARPVGDVTTIWRDGEVWRQPRNGTAKRLASVTPLPECVHDFQPDGDNGVPTCVRCGAKNN